MSIDQIWRVGCHLFHNGADRGLWSETWHFNTDIDNLPGYGTIMLNLAMRIADPFGLLAGSGYSISRMFHTKLWPFPQRHFIDFGDHGVSDPPLNPAAPEAAFRLQREGELGSVGRMNYPIFNDNHFTDRPHRRHVDVALLRPLLAAHLGAAPRRYEYLGWEWKTVIWHRKTRTWEDVIGYTLSPYPTRIWQRWRGSTVVTADPDFIAREGVW